MNTINEGLCVGLVGASNAGVVHAAAFKRIYGVPVHLKTVVDIDISKARSVKEQYGFEIAMESFDEMLKDKEINAVDICTPPDIHVEMIKKALQAGKHVICEKPLTGYFGEPGDVAPIGRTVPKAKMFDSVIKTMDDLKIIVDASDRKFCYADNYVYSIGVRKAAEIISKKKSKILYCKGETSLKGSASANTGEWSFIGGGSLIRAGCHTLSGLLVLKAAEALARDEDITVTSVMADVGTATHSLKTEYDHRYIDARPNDVEDFVVLSLTFSDGTKGVIMATDLVLGGSIGYMDVYTNDSALRCKMYPIDIVSSYFLDNDNLGDVAFSGLLSSKLGWQNPSTDVDKTISGFTDELQDFAECVATGRKPFSSFDIAYETMKVMYAAYQSAEEGRRIVF